MGAIITSDNFQLALNFVTETGVQLSFPNGQADADLTAEFAGKIVRPSWYTFRSIVGRRWINGVPYVGPTYYFGTLDFVERRRTHQLPAKV